MVSGWRWRSQTQNWTDPLLLDMAFLMVSLAASEMGLCARYKVPKCAIAPPAQALAKAVTPASPIWLKSRRSVCARHIWHIKRDCQAWRTRCQVSRHGIKAVRRQSTCNCAMAPPAQASAKAVTPASPIWFLWSKSSCAWHVWHTKQNCQAQRTRMPSLKAWDQDSEAPVHLQLRHCPTGAGVRQSSYTGVTDLVGTEVKLLRTAHMAHQTRLSSLENAGHVKSQGVGTRQ